MIVYADRVEHLDPRALLAEATGTADRVDALIAAGELEAGLTDAWLPDLDELDPRVTAVRQLTLSLARGSGRQVLDLGRLAPPASVRVSIPEGFAWYAVDPEAWADAARAFAATAERGPVAVVGLRSIGTTLSAVVHATLEGLGWDVLSVTVRPRGHPFDRRPRLGPRLAAALRRRWVLVVDEGPGLSGSSLCGTAAAIAGLGVPDEAIVLMPAHDPGADGFVSEAARARWPRHPRIVADSAARVDRVLGPGEDWSGGLWRASFGRFPPVEPRHERVKRLLPEGVARFCGRGRSGRRARARAERLAEAGLGPAVLGHREGFLVQERVAGRPARRGDPGLPEVVAARIRLARAMPADRPAPIEALEAMIATNLEEAALPVPDLSGLRAFAGEGAVAIDGRLAAHEWLRTPRGLVKTDGHDHCEDHFFPGFQDPAWDVAGAAVELGPGVRDAVLERLGDRALARRVPLYEVAYAAFRLGYAVMAREATSAAERVRWSLEEERLRGEALRAVAAI